MPKTQKTTKSTKAAAPKATVAKKASNPKKCANKKSCKCEPETHSIKNLAILWGCIFAAAMLGILAYSYLIPIIKKNSGYEVVTEESIVEETTEQL